MMNTLIENIRKLKIEYLFFILLVITRMPDLGHDNFNTDVFKWKARSYDFGTGVFELKFEKTLQKYHPGVVLMWLGAIGVKIFNGYYDVFIGSPPLDNSVDTIFQLDFIQKYLIVIFISSVLSFALYALKKLTNPTITFIFFLILLTEPYFVGLTRVMHLEGLVSSLILASLLFTILYKNVNNKVYFILSSLFYSLAILTKTSALIFAPMVFVMFVSKNDIKKSLTKFTLWFTLVLMFFVALWPSMWVKPLDTLWYLYNGISDVGVEGEHVQYYFGNLTQNPGLSYYPVVFLYRVSMPFLIGLILFIIYPIIYRYKNKSFPLQYNPGLLFYIIGSALFYLIVMSLATKKLDRYILPAISLLAIPSAYGYYFIYSGIKNNIYKISFVSTIFAIALVQMSVVHPDYLSYYNPALGGLSQGINIIESKWLIGQPQISEFTRELMVKGQYQSFIPGESFEEIMHTPILKEKLIIGFPEKYYTQIYPFIKLEGAWPTIHDLTGQAEKTEYFIFPVWDDRSSEEDRFVLEYYQSIYLRKVEIYRVYKNTEF